MRTFVIAEAGISHDGDLTKALKLIDVAREAGADACKFQTFNASAICKRRGKPELDLLLKPYEMPLTWLPQLKKHCDDVGIEFMTTCFDEETIKIVAPFVKRFKIGHGESMDSAFVRLHTGYGKEVIASFPDGSPRQIGADLKSLYVTKEYPTPAGKVRLERMRQTGCDGFSDHTREVLMGSFAVAAGAEIVEVHFRDWTTSGDNLDWAVSQDPSSLITYIKLIRKAELAVYGVDSGASTPPAPQQSAVHTSHRLPEGPCDPFAYHPAVEP